MNKELPKIPSVHPYLTIVRAYIEKSVELQGKELKEFQERALEAVKILQKIHTPLLVDNPCPADKEQIILMKSLKDKGGRAMMPDNPCPSDKEQIILQGIFERFGVKRD